MSNLTQEKLKEFSQELEALLKKYNVNLSVGQQIVVNENKPVETIKIETPEDLPKTE